MASKKVTKNPPLLVIIGVTDDRKARAARFDMKDETVARKAAAAMNMRCGIAKADSAIALAGKIPQGKVFESGLGMVPLVRSEVYYELSELLVFDETWSTSGVISGRGAAGSPELVKAADMLWSAVKIGSTVLAFEGTDPAMFGWNAAIVTAISKDGLFLDLRWRDWPEEKGSGKVTRAHRKTVAVLRPDVAP